MSTKSKTPAPPAYRVVHAFSHGGRLVTSAAAAAALPHDVRAQRVKRGYLEELGATAQAPSPTSEAKE